MAATSSNFIYRILCAVLFAGTLVTGAAAQSPPTISKAFSAATVGLQESVTLTFTLANPNPATDLTGVSFSDDMPAGLLIANPDSLGGTCDTSVVTLSSTNISLVGTVLPANSSCTLSIDVRATAAGDQVNTTGNITSTEGGTGGTATATVTVVVPDLTVAMSHAGNFVLQQIGATYTITVSNSGGADTSALIVVDDKLPAGLTATGLSGANWNCTLSPLECTRGDVLPAGTSFEPITLTVNVTNSAALTFINLVTVSGGGESNTANDTQGDVTNTIPALSMGAQTTNPTVIAGRVAQIPLNLIVNTPNPGTVTFACSGLPAASTCDFNPPSVTASTLVVMNITTTARPAAFLPLGPQTPPPAAWLGLFALGLAALALSCSRARQYRMRLAAALVSLGLLALAGCGDKTNTPVQGPQGTPAGTFAVKVTASGANTATAVTTVNLTVQ